MFNRFKFHLLTTSFNARGKCFGASGDVKATNSANERIAEATNDANRAIAESTNSANIQMNDANNQLQQKLQDQMNSFNEMMWEKNNEYNSPAAQIARGREGGLNPNSVLGNAVAASPVQQTTLPDMQAGHADPYRLERYELQPSRKDLLEMMTEVIGQANTNADTMSKVLANQNQSYINDFAPAMLAADLQGKNITNNLLKSNIKNVDANTLKTYQEVKGISQQISESKQRVKNLQMEWNNLGEDNYQKSLDNAFRFAMNQANLDNVYKDTNLKAFQVQYLGTMMKCESLLAYARANNLNWQNKVLEQEAAAKKAFNENGGNEAQAEGLKSAAQLYCNQSTGQDLQNQITKKTSEYQIRSAEAKAKKDEFNSSDFMNALDACDKIAGSVQKVGTGVGSVINAVKPGVNINTGNNPWVSTPTGNNPYQLGN